MCREENERHREIEREKKKNRIACTRQTMRMYQVGSASLRNSRRYICELIKRGYESRCMRV